MNITEAVTPEQKEAGQREMNKIYIDPINKLEEYYNKKWQHKTTTKEYLNFLFIFEEKLTRHSILG